MIKKGIKMNKGKYIFWISIVTFCLAMQNLEAVRIWGFWKKQEKPELKWDQKSESQYSIDMLEKFGKLVGKDENNQIKTVIKKLNEASSQNDAALTKTCYLFTRAITTAFFKISILEKCNFEWKSTIRKLRHVNAFLSSDGLESKDSLDLRSDVFGKIYNSFFENKTWFSGPIQSNNKITTTILSSSKLPNRWKRDKKEKIKDNIFWTTDKKWWLRMMWTEKPYCRMCIDSFIKMMALNNEVNEIEAQQKNQPQQIAAPKPPAAPQPTAAKPQIQPATKPPATAQTKNNQPQNELKKVLDGLAIYWDKEDKLNLNNADETTRCVKSLLWHKICQVAEQHKIALKQ